MATGTTATAATAAATATKTSLTAATSAAMLVPHGSALPMGCYNDTVQFGGLPLPKFG